MVLHYTYIMENKLENCQTYYAVNVGGGTVTKEKKQYWIKAKGRKFDFSLDISNPQFLKCTSPSAVHTSSGRFL